MFLQKKKKKKKTHPTNIILPNNPYASISAKVTIRNFQVLGVGLAVGLCITVIFFWALLNINKIQVHIIDVN